MPLSVLILILLAIAVMGFALGCRRAVASAGGDARNLHSRPPYYGANVALTSVVPAFVLLVIWLIAQPLILTQTVQGQLPDTAIPEDSTLSLVMSDVRRVADGLNRAVAEGMLSEEEASGALPDLNTRLKSVGVALAGEIATPIREAAQSYRAKSVRGHLLMTLTVLALALAGMAYALRQITAQFRARNAVERGVRTLLVIAASLAVVTTLGIVLSLIFNTVEFFRIYPASTFFGSFTWSPSFGGGSELGIWPLLWGTFYISIIALLVAVPIGLFAAIYLSEYAGPRLRAFAKPLIEILAGIPTIVYGLFALLVVGPMLVDVFGADGPLEGAWLNGGDPLMRAGTAVMTAGLVMGIMLIPFVSSLSDDIINAVPQAMRDGSYGLGATKSETIRQVVLPAALPGIVGAVLLAASRAIGETMIVVLGAGAAARLSMNPFDAMTTVTAKIVSQLTGDDDFASAEALVAFALGMTLFVITLCLNVFALYIVRKYREQYE